MFGTCLLFYLNSFALLSLAIPEEDVQVESIQVSLVVNHCDLYVTERLRYTTAIEAGRRATPDLVRRLAIGSFAVVNISVVSADSGSLRNVSLQRQANSVSWPAPATAVQPLAFELRYTARGAIRDASSAAAPSLRCLHWPVPATDAGANVSIVASVSTRDVGRTEHDVKALRTEPAARLRWTDSVATIEFPAVVARAGTDMPIMVCFRGRGACPSTHKSPASGKPVEHEVAARMPVETRVGVDDRGSLSGWAARAWFGLLPVLPIVSCLALLAYGSRKQADTEDGRGSKSVPATFRSYPNRASWTRKRSRVVRPQTQCPPNGDGTLVSVRIDV
eukprot:TRINITY_DN9903_c0_g1_i1.p1 TRINITY_DN9903_c0_g1~~TRINITY_DN9903_c0_g1_i1.p1  ORF type:complete len:334 (+),score=66.76 TRINITY_DN9903_c0_g1_i1:195-1196(+)